MITLLLGDGESENYAYDEEEDDDYQKSDKQLLCTYFYFRVAIVVSNCIKYTKQVIANETRTLNNFDF